MSAIRIVSTAVVAAVLASAPSGGAAQDVTVSGLVVTSSDAAPLAGVLVRLDTGERTRTRKDGSFRLEGIGPGPHGVALVAAGCQITFAALSPDPGEQVTVAFQMEYDPEVAAAARRASSSGRVIGSAEIERMRAQDVGDVLARLYPGMVGAPPVQPGQEAYLRSRGSVSLSGPVEPAIILDGSLLGPASAGRLRDIPIADVAWIQVARGASGGWDVGTGGSGGLVRIQTRRGPSMPAPFVDPQRCEIPGWDG